MAVLMCREWTGVDIDEWPLGPCDDEMLMVGETCPGETRPGDPSPPEPNDGLVKRKHSFCVLFREFGWPRHLSKDHANDTTTGIYSFPVNVHVICVGRWASCHASNSATKWCYAHVPTDAHSKLRFFFAGYGRGAKYPTGLPTGKCFVCLVVCLFVFRQIPG